VNRVRQIVLCVCVAAMTLGAWFDPLTSAANQQVDAGFNRALASFATARALNSIISMLQGTELAAQPFGMGIVLSLGQVLRPVNDMVEQFAHLMLVASIAFGIEKILINIGAHWTMSLALTVASITWGYLFLRHSSSPAWVTRVLVVLLMIRFAMPAVILGSDVLFDQFMAKDYAAGQAVIDGTTEKLTALKAAAVQGLEDQSTWDKVKAWISQAADIKTRLAPLKEAAEQATERMIKLIVIFVLQTLLLPIFLLWVLWGVAKGTFEVRASTP